MLKNRRRKIRNVVEQLESRLFMAATIVDGHTATYTDSDGDAVTIYVSKGTLTLANFTTVASGLGDALETIDFSAGGFDGANLRITVVKAATGDGLANVGLIDSTNHDLGAVFIKGDLGRILAGDAVGIRRLAASSMGRIGLDNQPGGATLPLVSTIVGKLGALSVAGDCENILILADSVGPVSIAGSFIASRITTTGDVGALRIAGDVVGNHVSDSGQIFAGGNLESVFIGGSVIGGTGTSAGYIAASGTIGRVIIRGSVIGNTGDNSGFIAADGDIGNVRINSLIGGGGFQSGTFVGRHDIGDVVIRNDIVGGDGDQSGFFNSFNDTRSIRVRGSIIGGGGATSGLFVASGDVQFAHFAGSIVGGAGSDSGSITVLNAITIRIGGSVIGSTGVRSGHIDVAAVVTNLSIAGSLVGGSNDNTGRIRGFKIGTLVIGGDIVGGSVNNADSLNGTGAIVSDDSIASLRVRGSIRTGTDNSTGALLQSGTVWAGTTIGSIVVGGSIIGSVGGGGDITTAYIIASGNSVQPPDSDLAIRSVSVAGRVEHAAIMAGYFLLGGAPTGSNGDAQIGAVRIGGDLIASHIVAGADNSASTNINFGDINDALIAGGNPDITSSIASIVIAGRVRGTPDSVSNTDHFGIVAQLIKSVKIGGVAIALAAQSGNDDIALGLSFDFRIHEV